MDIALVLAVLWRAKCPILGGALLGAMLAILVYGSPTLSGGSPSLTPRAAKVWQSESQLQISRAPRHYRLEKSRNKRSRQRSDGACRLSPVYATLANGDAVQNDIHQVAGLGGKVKASEAIDVATSTSLPFVNLTATAPTAAQATRLASVGAVVLREYVAHQQTVSNVPLASQAQLSITQAGTRRRRRGRTKAQHPSARLLRGDDRHRRAGVAQREPATTCRGGARTRSRRSRRREHVGGQDPRPETTNGSHSGDAVMYRGPVAIHDEH